MSAGVGAVAFAVLHGLRSPPSLRTLGLAAVFGLVVGALAAPEFEPKLFPRPALWQTLLGAAAGALVAVSFDGRAEAAVAGVIVGGFLGAFANQWVKHL